MKSRRLKKSRSKIAELERKLEEELGRIHNMAKGDNKDRSALAEDVAEDAKSLDTADEEASADASDTSVKDTSATLGERVETLEAELETARDQLLRARAEFDNYRKRVTRDSEQLRKTAAESLISSLLPVFDNLGLALQHRDDDTGGFADGVEMVLKQFEEVLQHNGLSAIPTEGEAFDPEVHEAIAQVESDEVEAGFVAQEYQKGYRLGDVVLRPSKVVVSKGNAKPEATENDIDQDAEDKNKSVSSDDKDSYEVAESESVESE